MVTEMIYQNLVRLKFLLKLLQHPTQRIHAWRWLQSLQHDYFIRQKQPWIAFDALAYLEKLDLNHKKVFEYGSGGSTLFWLRQGAYCVSVEHNSGWYQRIKMVTNNNPKLLYYLSEAEPFPSLSPTSPNPANPDDYISEEYYRFPLQYRNYVQRIDAFKAESFDVVSIDGRARPSCIKHSVSKVKEGGILMLDNADRSYYTEQTPPYLQNFNCLKFYGVVPSLVAMYQTNIYIRQY